MTKKTTKSKSLTARIKIMAAAARERMTSNARLRAVEQDLLIRIGSVQGRIDVLQGRVTALEVSNGPTWKTADGTVLRMREMEDSHLNNAIRFLEKQVVKRDLDKKCTDKEWTDKWVPKLNELRDERRRRETMKQNEAHWRHLHNGTGPYEIGADEFVQRLNGDAPFGKPVGDNGCVDNSLDPSTRFTTCTKKFAFNAVPIVASEAERITLSDGWVIEPTTLGERTLVRELRAAQEALKAKKTDVDGQTSYWKKAAESRLETLLRLRQTVKVLQDEVRRLKAGKPSFEVDGLLQELVRKTRPFKALLPGSRGQRLSYIAERLTELLGT